MTLNTIEKSVIITALQQDMEADKKAAAQNPALKGYVERNIRFRNELIVKLEKAD